MENIRLLMASGGAPLVIGYLVAMIVIAIRLLVLIEAAMYEDDDEIEDGNHG